VSNLDKLIQERWARGLLDSIAATEADGYDRIYGKGGRLTDFSDHPRKAVRIESGPNKGRTSSAAGRYQFLGSTWDEQRKRLGLSDFGPRSQDMAALDLAMRNYKTKTGRDLAADLQSGDPSRVNNVGRALSGTWTSLPSGIEQNGRYGKGTFYDTYTKRMGAPSDFPQPTNMPASPRQLGYETAAVQRGIQSPDLPGYGAGARWLDNKLGVTGDSPMSRAEQLVGRLGLSSTPRTSVQNQGFNDQAGPIPASQRPTQAATSANPRGYRPQARGGAGGMLAGLASAMMGGGDEGGAHVPHMPMDTNDYHSRSVQQSQVHSDRLSQLLQERWSKTMAPQTTPEEEMV
jgi:muramidase (phage lysozyme)